MDCPYYHGNIDGHQAESRLLKSGEDGGFLIRDSARTEGVQILCLLFEKKIFQYRILSDKNKKLYIESVRNQTVRQTSSLNELVEFYLSKGAHNGLKTSLRKGVRPDGVESSDSESEDDETYVDQKYVFGTDKDQADSAPDIIPALNRRAMSAHIYTEPSDLQTLPRDHPETNIRMFYSDQLDQVDSSKVSAEFVRKVQLYVESSLTADVMDMSKEESKLSASHLPKLKDLITEEAISLQRQLNEFISKIDFLREVVARPGVTSTQKTGTHIDSESAFNTLVGTLSNAKTELSTLEMEALNSFNDMVGYANVDPLALTRLRASQLEAKNDIPIAVFQVRTGNKAFSGPAPFSLKVDVKKGLLYIVKENSQSLDTTNTISADKIIQVIKSTTNSRLLEILIDGRRKDSYYFDNIRQREHFCQLIQQLKKVHTREINVDSLSIFCGTWNMGNESVPLLGLQPWIKSQGMGKTRIAALSSEPHDLYAIGTQEAKISERDWVNKVKKLLLNQFGIEFHLVDVCTLWQIRLVIFAKQEHKNRISMVQQAVVRTGIANALGNKGAATISLNFDGTSLCFMCCHLAANRERLARRNQNSRDIIKNLAGSIGNRAYADFDITNQFNHVFCLGDLNYRVDGDIKEVLQLAENEQYSRMLKLDQLLNTINEKKAFFGFDEEVITFPPTYRYHKQAINSFNWKKQKKSGVKINAPSWCDRVIWKSLPNCAITNTSYGLVQDVTTSDHKPVFASFTISILPQNINCSVDSLTTPIDIRMYDMSCELMTDQSNDRQTDYCISIMGACLEAPSESQNAKSTPVSEGLEAARWDDTLSLKPSFSDASHLQTQHVLIAVKSECDGMVIGDAAISLLEIFQSNSECSFKCDLTSLGGKTGTVRGVMKAIMKDSFASAGNANSLVPKKINYSNIIVNDIYAAPLGGLSWDDSPSTLLVADTMPRIRGRPMSFVHSKSSGTQRSLPPIPNNYDIPKPANQTADLIDLREELTNSSRPAADGYSDDSSAYYNVGNVLLPGKHAGTAIGGMKTAQANAPNDEGPYDCYEEAEQVTPFHIEPKIPARAEAPKPRKPRNMNPSEDQPQPRPRHRPKESDHSHPTKGTNPVTSWLLELSMPQYVSVFKSNGWTHLRQVAQLTKEQLVDGGVKTQHIFLLMDAKRKL